MFIHNQARERLDAAVEATLIEAANEAHDRCVEVAAVVMALHQDLTCPAALRPPWEATQALHAMAKPSQAHRHAAIVLHWIVARVALRPWLGRLDVLGWLARHAPAALLVLLRVLAEDPSPARSLEHPSANRSHDA